MRSLVACVVLIATAVAAPLVSAGRDESQAQNAVGVERRAMERPRIGLALSGGAARGLAHVGVLKVLDELRVPIDFVAGASMGSIVGGLFALGQTPAEIEAAINDIDWSDLFNDHPNRAQRSFRRKQDEWSDLLGFEFGIQGGKLKLPRSLVAGQKLAFAFDAPALHTAGLDGFDSLPVPFRAVSTDLRSGEMFVHDRGSLARALRASMSVPGFLAPVESEGRLLVDGGVVRNLPIDVVRDMGAEVVIAVDVAEKLGDRSREELASLLGLSFQVSALIVKNNTDPVLPMADVVLRPELGDLTMIDFERADEAYIAGERAARNASDALGRYSLSKQEYEAFLAGRPQVPSNVVVVDSIHLVNRSRINDDAIVRRLSVTPGDTLDFLELRDDLFDIHDYGSLELVDFELRKAEAPATTGGSVGSVASASGSTGGQETRTLHLLLNEKTYAPNLLRLGVWLNTDVNGRTRFQAIARLNRVAMNRLGAEWRTDARLGTTTSIFTEWYQPLKYRRRWFATFDAKYEDVIQDLYSGDRRVAEYDIRDALARLHLGTRLGRNGEVRTGLFFGWAQTSLRSGTGFPEEDGRQGGWEARLAVDSLDDGDFPRHGGRVDAAIELAREALASSTHYDRVEVSGDRFDTWGENTVFSAADVGTSLGTQLPPHRQFLLGGFGSLSGLHQEQLRGNVFASARLGYRRTLRRDVDILGTDLFGAIWFESGSVWQDSRTVKLDDLVYTASAALAVGTLIGPIHVGYGRTHRGDDSVFFTVGRQFGFD